MIFRTNALTPVFLSSLPCDCSALRIAMLTDSPDYKTFCGKGEGGAYTLKVSRPNCDWKMAIGDFISHAQAEEKDAVLVLSEQELAQAQAAYQGHTHHDPFLRPDEPAVLVHSTTPESWKSIQRDGALKSWNRVKRENLTQETMPIGHVLGDPEDFSDYVMFGSGVMCEVVVSSRQAGHIVMDVNAAYTPGARLYFDARRMAQDELLIRDGAHIKVKDCLPLSPYLIWAATPKALILPSSCSTPAAFSSCADRMFRSQFPQYSL